MVSVGARSAAPTYVAMAVAGFHAACRAAGCVERDLVVAGRAVRLRFAGPALVEPMSAALAHGEGSSAAPEAATVLLWDAASTGVPLPPAQWRAGDLEDSGQSRGHRIRGWDGEGVYTLHDRDPGYGAITVFEADSRLAIQATTDARAVPAYERAAPLRTLLHWSLSEPGRHLVHAGAVGGPDGGVLVAGPSGSGKSTLALSCVEAGLGYVGDDYVLVDLHTSPATAHAVHSTAKLAPESAGWLPAFAPAILERDAADGGKAVLDLQRHRPAALRASLPIRGVVLPEVSRTGRTRTTPASPARTARALAPSTVLQHFGHGAEGMATVAELVRRVPGHVLELGSDMADAVAAVRRLAEGAEA